MLRRPGPPGDARDRLRRDFGAAEASLCLALQAGQRIGVVAPSSSAANDARYMAGAYGLSSRPAGAVGVNLAIVDLEKDSEATTVALVDAARTGVERGAADAVVLGCTGMAMLAEGVRSALDVPVVERMAAAFKTAEMLAGLCVVHAAVVVPGGAAL